MITSGIYTKCHLLHTPERLDLVLNSLMSIADEFGWRLQAWAIMINHYHFIALAQPNARPMKDMLSKLHMTTAKQLNLWDNTPGRKVWYQYHDTHLTFTKSYFARLQYVHENPTHHKTVRISSDYPWCSSAWFDRMASPAFRTMIRKFKTDHIHVEDDF